MNTRSGGEMTRRNFFSFSMAAAALAGTTALATATLAKAKERGSLDLYDKQAEARFKTVKANGVHLVTHTFGDPSHPAVIVTGGANSSLHRMPEKFCVRLAANGRFVIRYDQRDAGRSVAYAPFDPPYVLADLADDLVGIFDSYGIEKGHIAGFSQGGLVAQHVALQHPDRVASLLLGNTTPDPTAIATAATSGAAEAGSLPIPEPKVLEMAGSLAGVDWTDPVQGIDAWVTESRVLTGSKNFDEAWFRHIAEIDYHRSINIFSARFNHAIAQSRSPKWRHRLGEINAKTLVLQGAQDPIFIRQHGEALAREIRGARYEVMEGLGHEFPAVELWDRFLEIFLEHTA